MRVSPAYDNRATYSRFWTHCVAITTYTYDAFGNVSVSGSSTNPFTYNQEWFDFGVGLQFLRARYVDLELSRFVSRDSVLGTLHDPRTHNLYLYVQNDPLNNIDPSGHTMQMGTGSNQPATLWGNCTLCNNDGRNVPANRTHCARCTRPRIDACRECGRQGCRGQCMTPARNAPLPPGSGANTGQRAGDANNAGHKHNSNNLPDSRDDSSIPARGATATTYNLEIIPTDVTRTVTTGWRNFASASVPFFIDASLAVQRERRAEFRRYIFRHSFEGTRTDEFWWRIIPNTAQERFRSSAYAASGTVEVVDWVNTTEWSSVFIVANPFQREPNIWF